MITPNSASGHSSTTRKLDWAVCCGTFLQVLLQVRPKRKPAPKKAMLLTNESGFSAHFSAFASPECLSQSHVNFNNEQNLPVRLEIPSIPITTDNCSTGVRNMTENTSSASISSHQLSLGAPMTSYNQLQSAPGRISSLGCPTFVRFGQLARCSSFLMVTMRVSMPKNAQSDTPTPCTM